jgi:hypothetical protein
LNVDLINASGKSKATFYRNKKKAMRRMSRYDLTDSEWRVIELGQRRTQRVETRGAGGIYRLRWRGESPLSPRGSENRLA